MMLRTIVIAALLLAGCESQPKKEVWVRSDGGGSQEILMADDGQCKAQAFSVPNAPMMQIGMVYNACMQGKGWYRQPQ